MRGSPRPAPGRFGPIDALCLAAAFAAAVLAARIDPRDLERPLGLPSSAIAVPSHARFRELREREERGGPRAEVWLTRSKWALRELLTFGTPALVVVTPGILLATYRGRGTLRRRARRGVGVITTTVAGLMVVLYLANDLVLRRLSGPLQGYGNNEIAGLWREIADHVSVAVVSVWMVLALGRRWHAEPHWRDRLGRMLGAAWVGYWLLDEVLSPVWLRW